MKKLLVLGIMLLSMLACSKSSSDTNDALNETADTLPVQFLYDSDISKAVLSKSLQVSKSTSDDYSSALSAFDGKAGRVKSNFDYYMNVSNGVIVADGVKFNYDDSGNTVSGIRMYTYDSNVVKKIGTEALKNLFYYDWMQSCFYTSTIQVFDNIGIDYHQTRTYYDNGLLKTHKNEVSDKTLTFEYNDKYQLSKVSCGSEYVEFSYDTYGKLTKIDSKNWSSSPSWMSVMDNDEQFKHPYRYGSLGTVVNLTYTGNTTENPTNTSDEFEYVIDGNGLITEVVDNGYENKFDSYGRLIELVGIGTITWGKIGSIIDSSPITIKDTSGNNVYISKEVKKDSSNKLIGINIEILDDHITKNIHLEAKYE